MAVARRERRKGVDPIPDNLSEYLNKAQQGTLHYMEDYGWNLKFVRRPLFLEPIPILYHPDNNIYSALNEDGSLNPDIHVR